MHKLTVWKSRAHTHTQNCIKWNEIQNLSKKFKWKLNVKQTSTETDEKKNKSDFTAVCQSNEKINR